MSCRWRGVSLTCASRESGKRKDAHEQRLAQGQMRGLFIFVRFVAIALLVLPCCSTVFAQEKTDLGGNKDTSRAGLTGAGAGGSNTTVEKPAGADGEENLLLGGPRHPLYRLQTSDVVEIDFVVAPEFNQTLTVQPDGYVMLRDAGMVEVQGLNMDEFSQAVRKAYRGYLHDPQVAVVLKEFERPYFIVGGEVGKPGKYELRSDTTVAEAVQIAGGLTQQSKHSQVVLFRRVNDDLIETRLLDLKKMLKERSLKEDAHLRPGDMVFVPQNSISKIARFLTKPAVGMYMNSAQF
jgi:polysaccharide biosynthesis/export protein